MAKQKLPQHKDDCIKCDLPTRMNGLYHPCMNCRNVAVLENERLQSIIDELRDSQKVETSDEKCNLASIKNPVCPNCNMEMKRSVAQWVCINQLCKGHVQHDF